MLLIVADMDVVPVVLRDVVQVILDSPVRPGSLIIPRRIPDPLAVNHILQIQVFAVLHNPFSYVTTLGRCAAAFVGAHHISRHPRTMITTGEVGALPGTVDLSHSSWESANDLLRTIYSLVLAISRASAGNRVLGRIVMFFAWRAGATLEGRWSGALVGR